MNSGSEHLLARLRVGLVGAGERVSDIYVPILKRLADRYEIVGFTTRSSSTASQFERKTGIRSFPNASVMVEYQKPTFLVAAVSSDANVATLHNLLDLKVPVLAETPLAWKVSDGKRLIQKAAEKEVPIAIAEQFTYRPVEQFKNQLIQAGIFGEIYAAYNDFSGYSYHGISQLRRYLNGSPVRVRCVEYNFGRSNEQQLPEKWSSIKWQLGSVTFDSGATLFHQYSSNYAVSDLCFPQTSRFYGRAGTMVDYDIRFFNQKSGRVEAVTATRQQNELNILDSISATLPDIGVYAWQNPYSAHPFSDEQIAVATLLDGMSRSLLTGCSLPYPAEENLIDIAIVCAFNYSARRNGAEIPLPFNETIQKALAAIWGRVQA
jgi:Oxidoreductase family, NAD-binding Rossmann fold